MTNDKWRIHWHETFVHFFVNKLSASNYALFWELWDFYFLSIWQVGEICCYCLYRWQCKRGIKKWKFFMAFAIRRQTPPPHPLRWHFLPSIFYPILNLTSIKRILHLVLIKGNIFLDPSPIVFAFSIMKHKGGTLLMDHVGWIAAKVKDEFVKATHFSFTLGRTADARIAWDNLE